MKAITIAWSLFGLRLACSPALLLLAVSASPLRGGLFVVVMIAGFISDVLDGIVARHGTGQTQPLRRADSQVDTVFWLSVAGGLWIMHPATVVAEWRSFLLIIGMQAACYGISLLKFGKENCTHAWLSKLWAIFLLIAFAKLALTGLADGWFRAAVVVGFIAHLDVIGITLILPEWRHDVPSIYHAHLVRRGRPFRKFKLLNG